MLRGILFWSLVWCWGVAIDQDNMNDQHFNYIIYNVFHGKHGDCLLSFLFQYATMPRHIKIKQHGVKKFVDVLHGRARRYLFSKV